MSATVNLASSAAVATSHNATAHSPPPLLDSQALLGGKNAVAIAHNGSVYRLQATRQGKLILTK